MKAYSEYKSSSIDWLGEIPSHWKTAKLKYVISISNGSDPVLSGDVPVYGTGENPFKTCGEFKNGPTVLLGRKGTIDSPHWIEGRYWNVDTAFDTKAHKGYLLRFFWHITNILDLNPYKSTTAVPSMTQTAYENIMLPFPPLVEQVAIAAYLDDVIGKIDELIAEKQKQVEDLRSYRISLITETVTRGLNHGATLRPSGIDWLGDIPEYWITTKAKYYIEIKSGDPISKDDINPKGSVPIFGGGEIIGFTTESNIPARTIIIGRVGARCGCVRLTDIEAWATDNALVVFTSQNPNFLTRIFEAANLNRLNESNAQPLITATKIKDLGIPLPPLAEQQAIAEFLDDKTEKIDTLISELEKQLEELAEYKKAVISEAVTGKVDVRDWKPQN